MLLLLLLGRRVRLRVVYLITLHLSYTLHALTKINHV